jgi:hypothetical protein
MDRRGAPRPQLASNWREIAARHPLGDLRLGLIEPLPLSRQENSRQVHSTRPSGEGRVFYWSMILKKPAPDLIRGGNRFSEKIMLKQETRSG